MTEAGLEKCRKARLKFAFSVMYEPHRFKVCEQCLGMACLDRRVCEFCGAYRWDISTEKVFEVAQHLRRTPIPVTMPYAPRC